MRKREWAAAFVATFVIGVMMGAQPAPKAEIKTETRTVTLEKEVLVPAALPDSCAEAMRRARLAIDAAGMVASYEGEQKLLVRRARQAIVTPQFKELGDIQHDVGELEKKMAEPYRLVAESDVTFADAEALCLAEIEESK